jgi:hypothetical protein
MMNLSGKKLLYSTVDFCNENCSLGSKRATSNKGRERCKQASAGLQKAQELPLFFAF